MLKGGLHSNSHPKDAMHLPEGVGDTAPLPVSLLHFLHGNPGTLPRTPVYTGLRSCWSTIHH